MAFEGEKVLLSVRQVAQSLNTSDSFVYARIADGSLPHYRLGKGGIRVSREQLEEYLKGRKKGGRPEKELPAPKPGCGEFKNLNGDRLLAAWRRQGALSDPPGEGNAPSSS
jgi:excisionase family DNA binding protein